ncbi:uncharacterized protein [Macrobrachium rosenbergii]|uniref:uncharacterized protein n=1 Tax=Macrobrachium rosenbergii TaxID=79674 RepID=UPI0034D6410F
MATPLTLPQMASTIGAVQRYRGRLELISRLTLIASPPLGPSQMLLLALALFTGTGRFALAQIEHADQGSSFTKGIDEISSVLDEYQRRCSVQLSDELEEKLGDLKNATGMGWKTIQELHENVTKAIVRTDELIHYNERISPTPSLDPCAWPFKRAAGSCFWIHKNPSLTWERARAFCQQEGGDLATPQDMDGVIRFLNRELFRSWLFVWFGGRKGRNGSWYWLSGEQQMDTNREHWSDFDRGGSCAMFHGRMGYKIGVINCDEECWYLCEKKVF